MKFKIKRDSEVIVISGEHKGKKREGFEGASRFSARFG